MPDKETLEAYFNGLESTPCVILDEKLGIFRWIVPRPDPLLGQPKTEEGRRIQRL